MTDKILFVYDNRKRLNKSIKNIVGLDSYGDIIYKRQSLKKRTKSIIDSIGDEIEYYYLNSNLDLEKLIEKASCSNSKIMHFYSNSVIINLDSFKILVDKINYLNETMKIGEGNNVNALVFASEDDYIDFLNTSIDGLNDFGSNYSSIQPCDCIEDISNYEKFLTFFSGGFEARHFNSITGDKYVVTKTSNKIKKIKAEHDYYYLLPDNMKPWFITPFNYQETKESASYSMERVNAPDMALQWVHEAISITDFEIFLDKVFYFINLRNSKPISEKEYLNDCHKLYIDKVVDRVAELKELKEYSILSSYVEKIGKYSSLDEIIDEYLKLYDKKTKNYKFNYIAVVGHGDLCFSNMLYYKEINLLKFIDVKGAIKEEELWVNPYYDIAKLSHSICGNYDFFNNDMYEIITNDKCNIELQLNKKNTENYKNIFKKYLETAGFDYELVRLYEASLFLSMLPLHIDNPKKVLGFILNAVNILEEVK